MLSMIHVVPQSEQKASGGAVTLGTLVVTQHFLQNGNNVVGSVSMAPMSQDVWHMRQRICSASGTLQSLWLILCAFAAASRSTALVNHSPICGCWARLRCRPSAIAADKAWLIAMVVIAAAAYEELTSNAATPETSSNPNEFSAVQGSDNESGPQV